MPAANTLGWDDEQIDEFKQAFYSFDEDGEVPALCRTVWACHAQLPLDPCVVALSRHWVGASCHRARHGGSLKLAALSALIVLAVDRQGTIGREELGQLLEALGENLTPPEARGIGARGQHATNPCALTAHRAAWIMS